MYPAPPRDLTGAYGIPFYEDPLYAAQPAAEAKPEPKVEAPKPADKGQGTVACPRNMNFKNMSGGYLFPVVKAKKDEFAAKNPTFPPPVSLGVGDTTHPIPAEIITDMVKYTQGLGTEEGYEGYDPANERVLQQEIVNVLYSDKNKPLVDPSEVKISDGSKCDLGRLQMLFGTEARMAVQDPAYPVYVDSSVMFGRYDELDQQTKQYKGIVYMPCNAENDFFPDLTPAMAADVIVFCNPNNPTGACATRAQLTQLVNFARTNGKIILYDAAYFAYIKDANCPRTIYEIPGAREVAIESNSFSKLAGFTGVRLGWTVCPKDIKWADGSTVHGDWSRIMATVFNGAPNVAIAGGLAVLKNMGKTMEIVEYYMANAKKILDTMQGLGFKCFGGENAPYIFVHFPGRDSWDVFDEILNNCHVVTTPGVGFGPAGQGYVRISAYGKAEQVDKACARLNAHFGKKPDELKALLGN
jgi:LL-diaminopimelate aminotransferase